MILILGCFCVSTFLLIFSLTFAAYVYYKSVLNYWKDRDIPFVEFYEHLRTLKNIFCGRECFYKIQQEVYNLLTGCKYGGYYEFTRPYLMIRDPELIERILITDFNYFHDRHSVVMHQSILSLNVMNAQGERWRNLRYKLTPTFTSSKLRGMFKQIFCCSDYLIKYIEKYNETQQQFDAKHVMNRFTMDVIATCAFGIEFPCYDKDRDKFLKMVKRMVSPTFGQMLRFLLVVYFPRFCKLLCDFEAPNYFIGLVRETIRYREENNITRDDFLQLLLDLNKEEELSAEKPTKNEKDSADNAAHEIRDSFQDQQLLGQKKLFTLESITAQAVSFLTVGVEGTTAVMAFFLYTVATRPDIQTKLQSEIDKVLTKHGQWNYQMLKEITYFDKVMQETMRMYPTSLYLFRVCTKPYQLPDRNVVLEPGVQVIIPTYALHHDPAYYPEPETFDPERFHEANYKSNGRYLPFGDGPRMCVAMKFALLEMKVCLIRLLSKYTIKLGNKTQTPLQFTPATVSLQPKGGIWLEFNKRNINYKSK